jgi:hypothetical protein
MTVTEVTKEDVFRSSEGGNYESAYWVVYLQDSLKGLNEQHDINLYTEPEAPQRTPDALHPYCSKIPNDIKNKIEQDNHQLALDIKKSIVGKVN